MNDHLISVKALRDAIETGQVDLPDPTDATTLPDPTLEALLDAVEALHEIAPASDGAHEISLTPAQTRRVKKTLARFDFGSEASR